MFAARREFFLDFDLRFFGTAMAYPIGLEVVGPGDHLRRTTVVVARVVVELLPRGDGQQGAKDGRQAHTQVCQ